MAFAEANLLYTIFALHLQNIDLHALTGWIPERIAMQTKDASFNSDATFDRLESGLAHGRCLLTVATGELSDDRAERTGLVPAHAYAVLNMKEINVGSMQKKHLIEKIIGDRFFFLKL